MDKNTNSYTLLFAVAVCVVLAVLLAATFNGLRTTIDANAEFDRQRNVLVATGLAEKGTSEADDVLRERFAKQIRGKVLEVKRAMVAERFRRAGEEGEEKIERVVDLIETEHKVEDLDALRREEGRKPEAERKEYVPLYQAVDESGATQAWCIPVSGYGLWSTLYGYLALKADLNEVQGITFYRHGETPGLGGEVDNLGWQRQWEGKKILDEDDKLVSVVVKKGPVNPAVPFEKEHMVDGLSGATITSNGVTKFVAADLERYEPYFKKLRN